jgi:hypothetical protein
MPRPSQPLLAAVDGNARFEMVVDAVSGVLALSPYESGGGAADVGQELAAGAGTGSLAPVLADGIGRYWTAAGAGT